VDVLVVDDDADTRELFRYLMRSRGWDVRVATSAEEALLEVAARRPDLLLLDVSLPRRDGIDLLRLLDRGLGRPRHVVLVSGLPESTVRDLAERHGSLYVRKPFTVEALDAVLAGQTGRMTDVAGADADGA
jgi:DNA-binding response OmpR family regulator